MINIDDRVLDALNESEVYLCLQISRYMKSNRMTAWPSIETLAARCKWDERTVKRWRNSLEQKGFLEIKQTPGKAPTYRFKKAGFGVFHAMEDTPAQAENGGARNEGGTFYEGGQNVYLGGVQNMHPEVISNKEVIRNVVSAETTAFSFPLESEMPTTASDAAWAVELFEPPVTEIIAPPAESASDTQPGDASSAKHAYTPEFEAFWKSYNYCAGSKLTASKRWGRLSAKEKALASDALPAHLRATTTDKARRKDSPFQPMRCHAAVYLSEKRWEAYAEVVKVAKGEELAPTKWDKKYKAYLRCCETRWPNMLASVAYLSKPDYCAFQDGAYLHGISRVGTEMQKKRFERMHDKWESGDPSLRGHSNIWPCFLAEMSAFIKQSSSL